VAEGDTNDLKAGGLSVRLLKKMSMVLTELAIENRPTPTEGVCDLFDKLRQDIVRLLSMQKLTARGEVKPSSHAARIVHSHALSLYSHALSLCTP
jgi:hypothetical protein